MNLQELITEGNIRFVSARNKEGAISELLMWLKDTGKISDIHNVYESILKNERNLCSSAGRGVAYPHGQSEGIKSFLTVIGISQKGIDWNSPDGLPCQVIVLTISPTDKLDDHCKFLSMFQNMISDSAVRSEIIDGRSIENIVHIIHAWEARRVDPDDDDV